MSIPEPTNPYPLPDNSRYCVFVRPTITSEEIEVGATLTRAGGMDPWL
jgi:hypothetical protein